MPRARGRNETQPICQIGKSTLIDGLDSVQAQHTPNVSAEKSQNDSHVTRKSFNAAIQSLIDFLKSPHQLDVSPPKKPATIDKVVYSTPSSPEPSSEGATNARTNNAKCVQWGAKTTATPPNSARMDTCDTMKLGADGIKFYDFPVEEIDSWEEINSDHYRAVFCDSKSKYWNNFLFQFSYNDVHRAMLDLATLNCIHIDTARSMHAAVTFATPYVMEMIATFANGMGRPECFNDVVKYYHKTTEPDVQDDEQTRIDMFDAFGNIADTLLARLIYRYIGCTFKIINSSERCDRYLVHSLYDLSLIMDEKMPLPAYMLRKCFERQKAFDVDQASTFATRLAEYATPNDLYRTVTMFLTYAQ